MKKIDKCFTPVFQKYFDKFFETQPGQEVLRKRVMHGRIAFTVCGLGKNKSPSQATGKTGAAVRRKIAFCGTARIVFAYGAKRRTGCANGIRRPGRGGTGDSGI